MKTYDRYSDQHLEIMFASIQKTASRLAKETLLVRFEQTALLTEMDQRRTAKASVDGTKPPVVEASDIYA